MSEPDPRCRGLERLPLFGLALEVAAAERAATGRDHGAWWWYREGRFLRCGETGRGGSPELREPTRRAAEPGRQREPEPPRAGERDPGLGAASSEAVLGCARELLAAEGLELAVRPGKGDEPAAVVLQTAEGWVLGLRALPLRRAQMPRLPAPRRRRWARGFGT